MQENWDHVADKFVRDYICMLSCYKLQAYNSLIPRLFLANPNPNSLLLHKERGNEPGDESR